MAAPVKVRWSDIRDSWIETIVVRMLTAEPEQAEKVFAQTPAPGDPPRERDFRVLIDGVEFDFDKFADHVGEAWDAEVERALADRIGEKLRADIFQLLDRLEDPVREIENALREEARKLLGYDPWHR